MKVSYKNITQKIKKAVEELDSSAEVILYGSRARGDAKKDSDWDILILVDKKKVSFEDQQKFNHKLYDVALEMDQCIMALVRSKKQWQKESNLKPLYKNIQVDGIAL